MEALVFAAGLGVRLRPLTLDRPKAMVEVAGKPLLYHVIMKLRDAGADRIVVNVHHFPEAIVSYLEENDNFGLDIEVSSEPDFPRETGGGVLWARRLLEKDAGEGFFAHNTDILSNVDLGMLRKEALSREALSHIVVSDRRTQRYFLFDDRMRLVGWTNIATGEVRTPYENLRVEECTPLAFSGIHFLSKDIFPAMEKYYNAGDKYSITDFYIRSCREYPIYGVVPPDYRMVDVGKLETLSLAEEFLAG